jgi:hypothetical protein
MDCGDGVVLDSTGCVGDNNTGACTEVVEMEVVEHAFLDFLTLELGLDEVTVEYGTTMFVKDEEKTAHNELDKLIGRLQGVDQDEDQTEVRDDYTEVRLDNAGDQEDLCSQDAYYGGGSWWQDRWLPARAGNVSWQPTSVVGHGKNVAVTACSVYEHIVRPKRILCQSNKQTNWQDNFAISDVNFTISDVTNISCAGQLKRKSSLRSGCWWPGAGSTASTRRPWQTTSGARSRLSKMKLRFEIINNQARIGQEIQILNDKSQCLFMPRAKESLVLGAGGARSSSEKAMANHIWSKE